MFRVRGFSGYPLCHWTEITNPNDFFLVCLSVPHTVYSHSTPHLPFYAFWYFLCHHVEGLQTTFPRCLCQLDLSYILPMGGSHATEEREKKVEGILLLVVLPEWQWGCFCQEAVAAMGDWAPALEPAVPTEATERCSRLPAILTMEVAVAGKCSFPKGGDLRNSCTVVQNIRLWAQMSTYSHTDSRCFPWVLTFLELSELQPRPSDCYFRMYLPTSNCHICGSVPCTQSRPEMPEFILPPRSPQPMILESWCEIVQLLGLHIRWLWGMYLCPSGACGIKH